MGCRGVVASDGGGVDDVEELVGESAAKVSSECDINAAAGFCRPAVALATSEGAAEEERASDDRPQEDKGVSLT